MEVRRSGLVAGSEEDGLVRIPAPSFLIEHRDGAVLFDASLAPEAAGDPYAEYGERAARSQVEFTAEQRLDRQVAAAGLAVGDVDTVVLSHLHFDHAGSAHLFTSARLLLGAGELVHARSGSDRYCRAVDVERVARCAPTEVDGDVDVFGDGSVIVFPTPGHTPGHVSLLVRLPRRSCLLTGDAVHTREALLSERPFPGDADPRLAVESIRRLKRRALDAEATICVSHSPVT